MMDIDTIQDNSGAVLQYDKFVIEDGVGKDYTWSIILLH